MILELDIGNSRFKWRLLNEEGRFRDAGVLSAGSLDGLSTVLEAVGAEGDIYISSVAGEQDRNQLSTYIQQQTGITPEFASSAASAAGLLNSYQHPETLGVDRWLAMIAAYASEEKPVCVIDAGTALTIDFVAAGGQHLGGYILPGLALSKKSLLGETAEIAPAYQGQAKNASITAGQSTTECIDHGIVMMSVAAIEKAIAVNRAEGFNVYLTGGDSAVLLDYLPSIMNAVFWPDLVLDGLGILYGYRPE